MAKIEMMKITLANLSEATEEQIFHQVYRHALAQWARATTGDDQCRYRTETGLKCAIGCLIDDSEYKPEFEGKNWHALVENCAVPATHESFISWLQNIHDRAKLNEEWIGKMAAYSQDISKSYQDWLDAEPAIWISQGAKAQLLVDPKEFLRWLKSRRLALS
ncbi:MAG: hypothetical protein MN733_36860 [Nitrososphaera sp.]|nr:hypothetical protein [Nitrososphaera sp.]